MICSYLGLAGGCLLVWLVNRYFNIFTFMLLIGFIGSIVAGAAGGFLLGWPLLAYLHLENSNWLWYASLAGAVALPLYFLKTAFFSSPCNSPPLSED